ncbi:MAG: hypothetical protein IPG21_18785 [Saprospiraceae bacterium]|nr:hypothetical protein [Candidatus Vicinibacter affinis]
MAKQGFLVLLKRVFEVHMQSAGVMQNACGAAWNLSFNNGNLIVVLVLVW